MSEESIFQRLYSEEPFVDRFRERGEEGVDVVIPLLSTNELWEKNLGSFYREIPIKRLLLGDGGCTDDSIEIATKFPRARVLDQTRYCSLGYCLRELIENVETEWFVYLHADVYLPAGWYDAMVEYQDRYDWYECKRHFFYMLYDTTDTQFHRERAYSGSQMGRKSAFESIISQIDDDYIWRTEDIFLQQKATENGFKYGKVPTAYHIHQVMNKKGEKEPRFATIRVKREDNKEWLLRVADTQFRATIKYLSPEIGSNVSMALINMQYVLNNSSSTYEELIQWVRETKPIWVSKVVRGHRKRVCATRLMRLAEFLYRKTLSRLMK